MQNFAAGVLRALEKAGVAFEIASPENMNAGGISGWTWEQWSLPAYVKKQENALLINLCNSAPLRLRNQVVTVHDLAFEADKGSWFRRGFRSWYKFMVPRICRNSQHIFTVSGFSKKEIVKKYNIPESKITVIPNGLPDFSFDDSIRIEGDYVLLTSVENPRKNAQWILENLDSITAKGLKLVVLRTTSGAFNSVNISEHESVISFENLPAAAYFYLLKNARALLYPSLYEGFGIPVLESLCLGTPVVATNLEVFRESFGELPAYFEPGDTKSFAAALEKALQQEIPENAILELKNNYNFEASASLIIKGIAAIRK